MALSTYPAADQIAALALARVRARRHAEQSATDWAGIARPEQREPAGDWRTWLILAGRGWGKALALDTPVPTPTGWTTMGDVRVGDAIFGADGRPTRVTFATVVQTDRTCYRVTFSDGASLVADADHRWYAESRADRRARRGGRVVTTEEMRARMTVAGERNWQMPVAMPLDLPDRDLPIDPWVLGFWLGDGDSRGSDVTVGDEDAAEVVAAFASAGEPIVSRGALRFAAIPAAPVRDAATGRMLANGSLRSRLREMDLIQNKHIPDVYLRASIAQREALLAGLLDSDGYVCDADGRAEIISVRRRLAEDIAELVRSLGHRVHFNTGTATLAGRVIGPKYRLAWIMRRPAARLARKRIPDRSLLGQPTRIRTRMVASIVPVASVPVRCITVDAPDGLFLAGREMLVTHNTRTGAETVRAWAEAGRFGRMALVGPTAADARDVMVEGVSGLLTIAPGAARPVYEPSKRRLTWPNGAMATTYSADEPDRLRGPQHDAAWADELAAWKYPETWDQLQMGLRGGTDPRQVVTTTPRPTRIVRELVAAPTTHLTRGRTMDNVANLAPAFLDTIVARYAGTRLGRQELDAEILDDVPGALWTRAMFDGRRPAPDMTRVVVALDPAVTSGEDSDETGIVVAGRGVDGRGYTLADRSCRLSPDGWGRRAVQAYRDFGADLIVAEDNNGGEMVEMVLRMVDAAIPVRRVHASRGKRTRAEPVAELYEQGRVSHVGIFEDLEDQLCGWTPDSGESPDRLDALVWAYTELLVDEGSGWTAFYRDLARRGAAA